MEEHNVSTDPLSETISALSQELSSWEHCKGGGDDATDLSRNPLVCSIKPLRLERSALWLEHKRKGDRIHTNMLRTERNRRPRANNMAPAMTVMDTSSTLIEEGDKSQICIKSTYATDQVNAVYCSNTKPREGALVATKNDRAENLRYPEMPGTDASAMERLQYEDQLAHWKKLRCPWPWSQVAWHHWLVSCEKSQVDPSSLTRVVRESVTTANTASLCKEAVAPFIVGGGTAEQGGSESEEVAFGPKDEEFGVLLGSVHGAGVAYLCMENCDVLRGKVVKRIAVRRVFRDCAPAPRELFNMILDLGPRD